MVGKEVGLAWVASVTVKKAPSKLGNRNITAPRNFRKSRFTVAFESTVLGASEILRKEQLPRDHLFTLTGCSKNDAPGEAAVTSAVTSPCGFRIVPHTRGSSHHVGEDPDHAEPIQNEDSAGGITPTQESAPPVVEESAR